MAGYLSRIRRARITLRKVVVGACLILLSLAGLMVPLQVDVNGSIACSSSASSAWQVCGPIEAYPGFDLQPAALPAFDGNVSLAWMANHNAGGTLTPNFNILYATRLTNGTWLQTSLVSTLGGKNQMPSLAQLGNGTILVFWSYQSTKSTHSQIYSRGLNHDTWSTYSQVTTTASMNDTYPSAAVGRDGTLWLAWTRDNDTAAGTSRVMRQLWYKTLKNGIWSPEASISSASDVNWNWQPSLMAGKDGIVRLAFATGQSSNGHYQINYMTYNGSVWSTPGPLSSLCTGASCIGDVNPSIMQDRNGTIWLYWSRSVLVGTRSTFVIYGENSVDNGGHWNSETALTTVSCNTLTCVDSQYPAAVQSNIVTDKNIWVFYATDPDINGFDIWGLKTTNPVYPVHDVAITRVYQPNAWQYPGGLAAIGESPAVTVRVTITDLGDFAENVPVTLTISNTTSINLGPLTAPLSGPGASTVLRFNWTTVFDVTKPAWYDLSAVATPVLGEPVGNQGDNSMIVKHSLWILPPGDVDQDGSTTANDVSQVKLAYGAQPCSVNPNNPICYLYNPYFDYTNTLFVDANDISIAIAHYGIFT